MGATKQIFTSTYHWIMFFRSVSKSLHKQEVREISRRLTSTDLPMKCTKDHFQMIESFNNNISLKVPSRSTLYLSCSSCRTSKSIPSIPDAEDIFFFSQGSIKLGYTELGIEEWISVTRRKSVGVCLGCQTNPSQSVRMVLILNERLLYCDFLPTLTLI